MIGQLLPPERLPPSRIRAGLHLAVLDPSVRSPDGLHEERAMRLRVALAVITIVAVLVAGAVTAGAAPESFVRATAREPLDSGSRLHALDAHPGELL